MDFKVAGTRDGITALQMDIKVKGLSYDDPGRGTGPGTDRPVVYPGQDGRVHHAPRSEMSQYAPRIVTVQIDPEKIGKIIGPGGKMIRKIQEECGVDIDIDDDGTVYIAAAEGPAAEKAIDMIEALTEEAEIGKVYLGKVVRTEAYGAFVEIMPGVDGLVHISQLADYRAPSVEDVVHVGDEVMVMVIDIEASSGKIRLSRQAVLEGWTAQEARERDRKGSSSGSHGGGRSRDSRGGGSGSRDRRPPRRGR